MNVLLDCDNIQCGRDRMGLKDVEFPFKSDLLEQKCVKKCRCWRPFDKNHLSGDLAVAINGFTLSDTMFAWALCRNSTDTTTQDFPFYTALKLNANTRHNHDKYY